MRIAVVFVVVWASAVSALAQGEDVGKPHWVTPAGGAETALQRAEQALGRNAWRAVAEGVRRVMQDHAQDWTARVRHRYIGARHRALRLLQRLPPEGRQAFEDLCGADAEQALRRTLADDDRTGLIDVVRRFEGTRAGLRAIVALADRALLHGRPAEARLLLGRLSTLYRKALEDPAVRARVGRAAARDRAEGGPPFTAFEKDAGARSLEPLPREPWPMIGGSPTRTALAPSPRFPADGMPPVQYELDVDIEERRWDRPAFPGGRRYPRQNRRVNWDEKWAGYGPVHPVIAGGILLHSDGIKVHATNLYGGDPLWSFHFAGQVESDGRTNLSSLFSPVVADGTVYVALEQRHPYQPQKLQGVPITYYLPERRLAALDLDSGDPLWQHNDAWLAANPRDKALLAGLTVTGSPLVRGNRVYVAGTKSLGTFHTYLLALDRRTGRVEFMLRVSNGQSELNLFGRQLQESAPTPVAEADGVLYYGTNLGMFVAVDALLGTPLWLTEYPIVPLPSTYYWFEAPRRWPLFENAPPLITADHIVIAPSDGRALLFLDRYSGHVFKTVRVHGRSERARGEPPPPRAIHGTDGERIFISGKNEVIAIRAVEDRERGLAIGAIDWRARFDSIHIGAGRGLVTRQSLLVPTHSAIYRFDPATGKRRGPPLSRETHPDNDRMVNLVTGDGVLVTASRDGVTARFDREQVIAAAKDRVRRAPNRPGVLLTAADVFLAVGRVKDAIEHYRRASTKAGQIGALAAASRAQLGLHRALLRRAYGALEEGSDRAGEEFDAAVRAAPNTAARLRTRIRWEASWPWPRISPVTAVKWRVRNLRALAREHGDAQRDDQRRSVRAWALLEIAKIQLERDQIAKGLKVLHALIEAEPETGAAREAVRRIGELLKNYGRSHYEPYELRAERLFAAARKSRDLGALERGLRLYGNARAAIPATIELAQRRVETDEPAAAARVLRRFLVEQTGSEHAPELAQARVLMIRALHGMKAYGHAYAAIQRLRARHGEQIVVRDDGARVTARALADEWRRRKPYPSFARSARSTELGPEVEHRFTKKVGDDYLDLVDVAGQIPKSLPPAVFIRARTRVHVYNGRTGEKLYALECDREPKEPLVFAGNRIHMTTSDTTRVFDATTGRALQSRRLPEGHTAEHLVEHKGQLFLVFRDRPRRGRLGISALHAEDGSVLWTRSLAGGGADRVHSRFQIVPRDGRLLVFSTNPLSLTVLDSTSGAIEHGNDRVLAAGAAHRLPPFPPVVLEDGRILLCIREQRPGRREYSMLHTYSLLLIDPSSPGPGMVLWRQRAPTHTNNRDPVKLERIGRYAVVLDQAQGAAVFEIESGKLVKYAAGLRAGPVNQGRFGPGLPPQPEHDTLLLVLTSGNPRRAARLSAFKVPELTQRYTQELTRRPRERARLVPSRGTLAFELHEDRRTVLAPRLHLVDPLDGAVLQKIPIKLQAGNVDYVHARVQNGLLVVVASDGRVHVYGPK